METNNLKQQAIEAAYGKYYKSDKINENGWFHATNPKTDKPQQNGFNINEIDIVSVLFWRPKSLKGIETNNGWIRIESEADLPKEYGYYHFIWLDASNNERCEIYKVDNTGINCPPSSCITHYQPITKPKPPIF